MESPEQHETDRKGGALFREVFSAWGVNRIECDYGRDYQVEVFHKGKSTGHVFNAQLKSSTVTPYSADGSFVSQSLEMRSSDYLALQLKQPTFLFHADVVRKQLYWSAIQLDRAVVRAAEEKKTDSLTVRIPTRNALPGSLKVFWRDLERANLLLAQKALMSSSVTDFVEAVRGQPVEEIVNVAEDLHERGFRIELQAARDIFRHGKVTEAMDRLQGLYDNPAASVRVKFNAALQLGEIDMVRLAKSDQPQIAVAERQLLTGKTLCVLVRKGPTSLRLFAIMSRVAAEFGVIAHQHFGLIMNWKGRKERGTDLLWLAVLSFKLDQSFRIIGRKYRQVLRLARFAAKSRYRRMVPLPLIQAATQIATLAAVLETVGFEDAVHEYRRSAFDLFKFAAAVAIENGNDDELWRAATAVLLVDASETSEAYKWSRSMVERWPQENEYRVNADQLTERTLKRKAGIHFEGDITTNPRQIHQNLLSGMGLDPASEPWRTLIDNAIKDGDPTRILKTCEHTLISTEISSMSRTLENLGLRAADVKTMHCTLHKFSETGPTFDGIYETFHRKHCSTCKDNVPRPDDWKFSPKWQELQNKRWSLYLGKFWAEQHKNNS